MSLPPKRDRPRTTGTRGDWDITPKAAPKKKPPAKKARSTLKSSKGLDRGKPLERGKPIERGDSQLARTTRLKPVSDQTAARRPEREAVRKLTCALAHLGPCDGPIDTHEIVRRSQLKGAAYLDELTIGLCRLHHGWDTYKLFAEWVGLRIPVDFYKQDPEGTVAEAARRRTDQSGVPSWWGPEHVRDWHKNLAHYPRLVQQSSGGHRH